MSDEQTFSAEIKELGDKIVALTVGKAVELGDYLEKVHGIKPAAGGAVMMAAAPGAAAAGEAAPAAKTEFTVVLEGNVPADKKISIIKVVREITQLGLKEAKVVVRTSRKTPARKMQKPSRRNLKMPARRFPSSNIVGLSWISVSGGVAERSAAP